MRNLKNATVKCSASPLMKILPNILIFQKPTYEANIKNRKIYITKMTNIKKRMQ